MKKAQWATAVVLMILLCAAAASAKSNFTGDWKMNPAKSEFGPMPAPSSITQKITHNDPELKVTSTQVSERGEFTTELAYTTDGKECINKMRMGESKSTLKWDGDALVIDAKLDFQGNPVTLTDTWTLSPDGKTLTVKRHFSSQMGEGESTIVMEKQ